MIHPISDSQMNERYTNRQSSKVPPRAMSVKASLNSRYIDTNSDQASVTPRKPEDYWNGLSMETPRYPPPPPLTPPLEVEVLSESLASPGFSRQSSVQEAPITHQDIMSQINNEILGLAQNRYAKKGGRTPAHQDGGAVSKNVAKKKKGYLLISVFLVRHSGIVYLLYVLCNLCVCKGTSQQTVDANNSSICFEKSFPYQG